MTNTEVVAARRDEVMRRWLRGQSVSSIASETGATLGTIKHDLTVIRRQLADEHGPELRLARAALLASVRDVLQEVWRRVEALQQQPDDSRDERALAAYLSSVLRAHALLAKVTGLTSPPSFQHKHVLDATVDDYSEREDERRWGWGRWRGGDSPGDDDQDGEADDEEDGEGDHDGEEGDGANKAVSAPPLGRETSWQAAARWLEEHCPAEFGAERAVDASPTATAATSEPVPSRSSKQQVNEAGIERLAEVPAAPPPPPAAAAPQPVQADQQPVAVMSELDVWAYEADGEDVERQEQSNVDGVADSYDARTGMRIVSITPESIARNRDRWLRG